MNLQFAFTKPMLPFSKVLLAATFAGVLAMPFAQAADKSGGPIGFEMVKESSDAQKKIYTLEYAVWTAETGTDRIEVRYRTQDRNIKVLSGRKVFKGPLEVNQRKTATVKVENRSSETSALLIDIKRHHGKTWDSKTVQVQVAPM